MLSLHSHKEHKHHRMCDCERPHTHNNAQSNQRKRETADTSALLLLLSLLLPPCLRSWHIERQADGIRDGHSQPATNQHPQSTLPELCAAKPGAQTSKQQQADCGGGNDDVDTQHGICNEGSRGQGQPSS